MATRISKDGLDTEQVEVRDKRTQHPQRVAVSRKGMIATAHYAATAVGAELLVDGGNAVDAAVGAAFALGICEPAASGLGGQTMLTVHLAKQRRNIALDGSSHAPFRATAEAVPRQSRLRGYLATTVPSTPAVLAYALKRYGTFPLPRVLEPVIRLAETGYQVSQLQHNLTRRELRALKAGNAGRFYLAGGERPYPVGTTVRFPVLAETLRRLARKGVEDFYAGGIAKAIAADMKKNGGLIQLDDLAQIPYPIERRPVSGRFGDSRVITFPPPAAGRTLIELLNILSQFPARRLDLDTPGGALLAAESIRRAFLDRRDRPFDPNFYPQVSEKSMLSVPYSRKVAREIRTRLELRGETTHLSAMDGSGNCVALTQSIERVYGSCVASEDLGFLYNDYMSAFEYQDISHPYYLRPGAVPWASVAPTILLRGTRPWLVIGSPGSQRITSSIAQVLVRLRRQGPLEAVAAPRLHCSLDGVVALEASRMRNDIPAELARCGFVPEEREPYSFYLGCVQLVTRDRDLLTGVADPRRDGSAAGPA